MEFNRGNQEMARSNKLVMDASIVVKWFVEEKNTDKALSILDDYSQGKIDLISVQLMPFEVINALRYDPNLGVQDLIRIGKSLSNLQIALFPLIDGLYSQSIKMATEYGITVYDASYLSLAISTGCQLYTADAKFADKIGKNEHIILFS